MSILTSLESQITGAVEKLSESVVSIDSVRVTRDFAYGVVPIEGKGSGLIIDSKGYVITNNHVIDGAAKVQIHLKDGRSFVGEVVGSDPSTDIAVVHVEAENLPAATLGDSEGLKVGQLALAIGNTLGLQGGPTVSLGVVSALGRPLPGADFIFEGLIQTDTAINPGNSGGPLADISGNVIGMNTAMIPYAQGVGFAIPVNTIKWVMQQIREKGRVVRPWLGIYGTTLSEALARRYDLPADSGVLVVEVDARGPAYRSGLRVGDVIIGIGSHTIIQLAYFGSFIVLMFYGQRIQISMMLVGVKRNLGKLERLRKAAHDSVLSSALRFKGDRKAVESRIDRLTGSFAIQPVSMDPSGIVGKLEHILDTYDDNLRTEVKAIATSATEAEVNTLSNQLEISIGADQMYRVVRHFYLLARKQGGILALYQLQMAMPQIMEEAEAYSSAIDAFAKGNPIGDGIGPLIASKMAEGAQSRDIEQDTIMYETGLDGRTLLLVRAKGPGGSVGKPGIAVEKLIEQNFPSLVVPVDAALKFEGEPSGEVAEGVGAAIGGPGVDRYHIEQSASKRHIPMIAIVVKMSNKEAISAMTQQVRLAVDEAIRRVKNTIQASSKSGDTVIVAGIGNTMGIP